MHKVEQSECSPGNRSQRRRTLPKEEETSLHKDSVCGNSTIYIFWRPHLKIIRDLITKLCCFQTFHHFIWQICKNLVHVSPSRKWPGGLLGLKNFSQEGFLFGTLEHSGIATSKVTLFKVKDQRSFSLERSSKDGYSARKGCPARFHVAEVKSN